MSSGDRGRKPRADAQRNSERLIEAAKGAFAELGPEVSLEEIARRAGVGIGTLYRNFPSREAIVEAVYRREVEQLADAAKELLAAQTADVALHQWMRLFVSYLATKKVIAPALSKLAGGTSALFENTGTRIRAAVALLVESGVRDGALRPDAQPADIIQAMLGFSQGVGNPGWEDSTLRLIGIFMDGLRHVPPRSIKRPRAR